MSAHADMFPGSVPSRGVLTTGRTIAKDRGANAGLAFHPGGIRLVSGWCGSDSAIDVWLADPVRHIEQKSLEVELSDVGSQPEQLLLPPGGEPRTAWPAHLLPVVDLAVSGNGERAIVTAGRAARVFRFGEGHVTERAGALRAHEAPVVRVALNAVGDRAITVDPTGRNLLWGTDGENVLHELKISRSAHSAAFLWNDMLAAVGDDVGRVVCWDVRSGRRHLQFQAHRAATTRMSFNRDSALLLTVGNDHTARMWNLEKGSQVGTDLVHRAPLHDATFIRSGQYAVTAGADGHVGVWSARDGRLLDWYFAAGPVYRLAWAETTGMLALSGPRGIEIVDIDFDRLRDLETSMSRMDIPTATSYAGGFKNVPSRPPVNYSGGAQEAPVGSIMAARQTTDLPYADRSGDSIRRGPAPAPPSRGGNTTRIPAGSVRAAHNTAAPQAVDGRAQAWNPYRAAAAKKSAPPPPTPEPPVSPRQPTPSASPAADFFSSASSDSKDYRATGSYSLVGPRVEQSETSTGDQKALEDILEEDAPDDSMLMAARVTARREQKKRERKAAARVPLLVAVLGGLVVALAGWQGVAWYYTSQAWPSAVAAEAQTLETAYEMEVSGAQAEFDAFVESSERRVAEFERSTTMTRSEMDRLRANIDRQIEVERERFEAVEDTAREIREAGFDTLSERRKVAADRLGMMAGGGAGGLLIMIGFVMYGLRTRP